MKDYSIIFRGGQKLKIGSSISLAALAADGVGDIIEIREVLPYFKPRVAKLADAEDLKSSSLKE